MIRKIIVFFILTYTFIGCHLMSCDMKHAARDDSENARIQMDSSNKVEAMRLFMEEEDYGFLADGTLTVAHAQSNIAKCLDAYVNERSL